MSYLVSPTFLFTKFFVRLNCLKVFQENKEIKNYTNVFVDSNILITLIGLLIKNKSNFLSKNIQVFSKILNDILQELSIERFDVFALNLVELYNTIEYKAKLIFKKDIVAEIYKVLDEIILNKYIKNIYVGNFKLEELDPSEVDEKLNKEINSLFQSYRNIAETYYNILLTILKTASINFSINEMHKVFFSYVLLKYNNITNFDKIEDVYKYLLNNISDYRLSKIPKNSLVLSFDGDIFSYVFFNYLYDNDIKINSLGDLVKFFYEKNNYKSFKEYIRDRKILWLNPIDLYLYTGKTEYLSDIFKIISLDFLFYFKDPRGMRNEFRKLTNLARREGIGSTTLKLIEKIRTYSLGRDENKIIIF